VTRAIDPTRDALDPDDAAVAEFVALDPVNVLLTAAAGCGNTEALAVRTARLVSSPHVQPQQQVLAATFSIKARDNLRTRIRRELGLRKRGLVVVQNFHGVAARILLAHGRTIGLDPETLVVPQRRAHSARQAQAGITWANRDQVEAVLRSAKGSGQSDEEVLATLEAAGNRVALTYERLLRSENAIDFEDLLRHAARILQNDEVALGYRKHFAAVVVDEVQDLSLTQLRMVQHLGSDRITYAGDIGQGIYSFAGADPEAVFEDISFRVTARYTLTRSFRSSPGVLRAVNALARLQSAEPLRCAEPDRWPESATFSTQAFENLQSEATAVVAHVLALLAPGITVGVLARGGPRLRVIRSALENGQIAYTDWSAPLGDARTIQLLRDHASAAISSAGEHGIPAVELLQDRCHQLLSEDDVDSRDAVAESCHALRDLMAEHQIDLRSALARCRTAKPLEAAVGPGLHLLNAHLGKGQEFDHAVVVGLEEGILPDFRSVSDPAAVAEELRTLIVMVSRARGSLLVTRSADVPAPNGRPTWLREPSRWWHCLEGATLL